MSGFSKREGKVSERLMDFSLAIIKSDAPVEKVRQNKDLIDGIRPGDVIALVDELVRMEIPLAELKKGINKLINLFHDSLNKTTHSEIRKGSFLDYLAVNNAEMEIRLKNLRPLIRSINKNKHDINSKKALLKGFSDLEAFSDLYVIKENVLFPVLEKKWTDFRCLQVMWSFQDDIRRNRKQIVNELKRVDLDLPKFNKLAGDLFFNLLAIKFRDEKILFPIILKTIPEDEISQMLENCRELRFPYIQPQYISVETQTQPKNNTGNINLGTGFLSAKQIELLFNHIPVDITFVDEHNKVQYFSTPSRRIFPRSKGVIGRDVKHCHPPESVHIVEEIIEEFRKGNQEKASFWIKMGEVYVLIQYFAIRDKKNKYCGVVEVSQEISEIKKISGEQRLLDWSK